MPAPQFRDWCFTCHNTEKVYEATGVVQYVVYQDEEPEGVGRHQQGYAQFKDKISGKAAAQALGFPTVRRGESVPYSYHLEPRAGSQEQAIAYCTSYWYCRTHHKGGEQDAERCCEAAADKGRVAGPFQFGEQKQSGRPKKSRGEAQEERAAAMQEILQTARQQGTEAALERLAEVDPETYLRSFSQAKSALEQAARPKRKRYELPDLTAEEVRLRPWQQQVFDLLQEAPVPRRIIWVQGDYDVGKSWFATWLSQNFEYGVFFAGQGCSMNNLAFTYNEEGLALWDFPREFDWDTLGKAVCSVIEKFSDFGQPLPSQKYGGKTPRARCHVVVFANAECPEGLRHRDIVPIKAVASRVPEMFQPPGPASSVTFVFQE